MHDAVKAGNVTALERKSLAVFRKHAEAGALTCRTCVTTHCHVEVMPSVCVQVEEETATCSLAYRESHLGRNLVRTIIYTTSSLRRVTVWFKSGAADWSVHTQLEEARCSHWLGVCHLLPLSSSGTERRGQLSPEQWTGP